MGKPVDPSEGTGAEVIALRDALEERYLAYALSTIMHRASGYTLDFDVRHLWMRQKQIIGSHFANAYECMKANDLMAEGKVQPVLWKTMGFDGVPEAHQMLHENRHLGKIAILVGATSEDEGREVEGPGAIRAEVGA